MSTPTVANYIFKSQVIVQNTAEEAIIKLERSSFEGFFSVQIELTGTGNINLTYAISNNGVDYITPTVATDIATGFAAASGPGSDGKDILSFEPMLHQFLKIIATEQNIGGVVLNAWLAIQ